MEVDAMVLGCMGMSGGGGDSSWLGMILLVAIGLVTTVIATFSGTARTRREPSLPAYPFASAEAPKLSPQSIEASEETDSLVEV
jgi:hypothetical protein